MDYRQLLNWFKENNFMRIERDDRFLDIFPAEHSEKGIEVWEKWEADYVLLVRLHLPFRKKFVKLYKIPRKKLETALMENKVKKLTSYKPLPSDKSFIELL